MEDNLAINLITQKNFPAKIAIMIYWAASLLDLLFVTGDFLATRHYIFSRSVSGYSFPKVAIYLLAAGFVFAVLQLFLAFELSTRKNWARMVVVGISTLLAAGLIYQAYLSIIFKIPFLHVLKNTYWLIAEIVAASLLLLPKSKDWFAPKRASA